MKKFIATIPRQPEKNLKPSQYEPMSEKLSSNIVSRFPIVVLIDIYAKSGDDIEIDVLTADYDDVRHNLVLFKDEVDELCKKKDIKYTIKTIDIPFDETTSTHIQTIGKLTSCIKDNDMLYCCITYGTKPTPLIEIYALNYAARINSNVSIESIVYGEMNFSTGNCRLFDVSALFYLNSIIDTAANLGVDDLEGMLKTMLNLN